MIKHVILWNLKDSFTDDEKAKIKADAKEHLEALTGKIPGLLEMKININPLPTSTADMMLDSSFESTDALKNYASHPEHVAVADTYVRPYTMSRSCLDFEV